MRILVLNWLDRGNPSSGGAEIHLHETFGRLVERGHTVTLVCSGFTGAAAVDGLDGIEVHRTGGRYTFSFAAPRYVRSALGDRDFDVVVEDLNKVPLFTPRWIDRPLVLLVHHLFGGTAFREASPPVAAATWLLERPVPAVYRGVPTVAVSESTATDLAERGMERDGIRVIHNGVDADRFTPDSRGGRFPDPTLLYLGRLKKYKRLDLVLRAVAGVEGVELLVAGVGDHRGELEALRDRLGIGNRVRFLGWVDEDRKIELFRKSWIHVLTSSKEGWGIANLEAAACGTPSVASDRPGLRDSVLHGETGLLVPHGDVEALAGAIRRLVDDPEERRRLGRGARRFAEAHSWDYAASLWEGLLESVATGVG